MKEARQSHSINSRVLTAGWKCMQQEPCIPDSLQVKEAGESNSYETCLSTLQKLSSQKAKRGRKWKPWERRPCSWSESQAKWRTSALWGDETHRIWNPAIFDACQAGLSVEKNFQHDRQRGFPKGAVSGASCNGNSCRH